MADGPKVGDKVYYVERWGFDRKIGRAEWLDVVKVTPGGQFTVQWGARPDGSPLLVRFKPDRWAGSHGAGEIGGSRRVIWGEEAERQAEQDAQKLRRQKLDDKISKIVAAIEARDNRNDPAKLLTLADELKAAAQALVDFDAEAGAGAQP